MHKNKHAKNIANRFRELVENAGHSLQDEHYDELELLIEAGIDTDIVGKLERISTKLNNLAHAVQHDAEFFD